MRFDRLHLQAYGSFTDRDIDLAAGEFGLHVLYGPNEAGKSTALRAVRALLFGVPERSGDTFRHDARALRVGAVLRSSRGEVFTAYRRKGRKDTLLDERGNPQDQKWLSALLQGVDEARFATLFGIDHESLVAGGRSLLAERGREAEALFGSGIGSTRVHEVLADLDREAQEIFAPRGQKPSLNALLRELDELRREAREAALPASRWDEARKTLEQARAGRDAAAAALAQAEARRDELERLRRTLPAIAQLAELEARLAALGDAPLLAEDFAARRARAADRLREGEETLDRARRRLEDIDREMQGLDADDALLDEAAAIDDLHARLGEWRRLGLERPSLEAQEREARAALARQLALLGEEGADPAALAASMGSRLAHRARAEELARQHEARESQVCNRQERLEACARQLAHCASELAQLPPSRPSGPLRDAIKVARGLGNLDERIASLSLERTAQERSCVDGLAALGRFSGAAVALLSAPLPDAAELARFQSRFQEAAGEERRLGEAARDIEKRRRDASAERRVLEAAGPVPSLDDLARARALRDRGWSLIDARWRGADPSADAVSDFTGGSEDDAALARAFETALSGADTLADRLHAEASSVHAHAALEARLEACRAEGEALERDRRDADARRAALDADWSVLWQAAGVDAGSVEAMSGWLQRAEKLREQVRVSNRLGDELGAVRASRDVALQTLRQACDALAGSVAGDTREATARAGEVAAGGAAMAAGRGGVAGESLAVELARAEALLDDLEEQLRRQRALAETRTRLDEEHAALTATLARASTALDDWRSAWSALCRDLALDREPTPGELSTHFDVLQAAANQAEACTSLSARLAENERHRRDFAVHAAALCRRVVPALAEQPPEEQATQLYAALREQQKVSTRLGELRRQRDDARGERDAAQAQLHAAGRELDTLCEEAGGVTREALEEVERVDRERGAARRDRETRRNELLADGDGFSIDELGAAAHGVDRATVHADLEQLNRRIREELAPARDARAQACFEAERDFAELGQGAGAGELEAAAQQVLAGVRDEASRYLRVRMAALVLREQIDRFRQTHRDPILAAAGGYFATLTGHGFDAVETDFDASDTPVLSAVRADGERLLVDALSTGTRDQLFLALRLAALEHYLDTAEPLPFVVDDILVQFDDVRTRATLAALAHFSRRTQVLLFTHHARVAEDAALLAGEGGGVFVHSLVEG